MTIRRRTARRISTLGLATAGMIHLAWATGSTWPRSDADRLADLVVGVRPFPSPPMTATVVGLITVAIAAVETESRSSRSDDPAARARRLVARGVPGVLALRGIGGLVGSSLELGTATDEFRHWDLRIYSPLCLVLAAAAVGAIALPRRAD